MFEDDEDMKSLKTLAQDLDTFITGGLYVIKINIYTNGVLFMHPQKQRLCIIKMLF